jgi:hypothetical protein
MGSSSKKRQTMAKITRQRELQERRAQKQEKKELKKQAAAERAKAADTTVPAEAVDDDEARSG